MAHIAAPAIGLNTQQNRSIGVETTDVLGSRGAKTLGFIGFGMTAAGASLTGRDAAPGSFLDSTPVLIPQRGGVGFAMATPVWSASTLSWTIADPPPPIP